MLDIRNAVGADRGTRERLIKFHQEIDLHNFMEPSGRSTMQQLTCIVGLSQIFQYI